LASRHPTYGFLSYQGKQRTYNLQAKCLHQGETRLRGKKPQKGENKPEKWSQNADGALMSTLHGLWKP
jgi:hypothetical protein